MSAAKTAAISPAPDAAETRSETVSALERGISVLRCFSEDQPVLGYADIARMTGIPRPTVNRLVATLHATGMLKPALTADRFMLGPAVVTLARVFLGSLDVRAVARPKMQAMAESVGASVYLAVRDGSVLQMKQALQRSARARGQRLSIPAPAAARGLHALVGGLIQDWLLDPQAFQLEAAGRPAIDAYLAGLGLR